MTSTGSYHSSFIDYYQPYIHIYFRISGQNQMLNDALRTVAETEDVGTEIIGNLKQNRETINSAHDKVCLINFL